MKVDAEGFKKMPILEKKGIHIENYLKEHQHEYYVWQYGHGSNAYIHHSLPIYLREGRETSSTNLMPDFVPHVFYLLYCGVTDRALFHAVSFVRNKPALNNHWYYAFTPDKTNEAWYITHVIIQLFSTRFLSKQNTANSCP